MRCGIPASHCGGSRQVHQIRRGRKTASTRRILSIAIGQLALARDDGTLNQAGGKKRGREPKAKDPSAAELICLRRDRDRLAERLRQAELIIEVQKNFRTARCQHQSDGRREDRMIATQQLGKEIGIARACHALDVPRATYYRRLKPAVSTVPAVRRTYPRTLSDEE